MRPDHRELSGGVKLAAIALISAILTATLVIGAGRGLLPGDEAVVAEDPALNRVAWR